jgi:non-specific serine/threonine protein kinase/serine/threonine-protein kinase
MAEVYLAKRATDHHDDRLAALKTIAAQPPNLDRFLLEQRILARLRHPNIVRYLESGTCREGRAYIAMEYISGQQLDVWRKKGQPSLQTVLRVFLTICKAVHFVHQHDVIHRDLKPSNIIVTGDATYPSIKVIDFGVSKWTQPGQECKTEPGLMLGTPDYMSPEQATVIDEPTDQRSDIYGLGALLYLLLCERPPFNLNGKPLFQVMETIARKMPLKPSKHYNYFGLSNARRDRLDCIVLKALAKSPADRYHSVMEMVADLELFAAGCGGEQVPATPRWRDRFRKLLRRSFFVSPRI